MIIRLARVFSYVFHPVFMPFLGVLIIFNSGIYIADIPFEFKKYIYTFVLLCTLILPLTLISALYLLKYIQKFTLQQGQERVIPLIFTTICYYLGYFLLSRYSPVKLINVFLFSSVLVVLTGLLISLFWKISIHMAGAGGITALVLIVGIGYSSDMTLPMSLILMMGGVIATSRLALRAHSPIEIIAGFLLGFLLVGGTMFRFLI